MRVFLSGRLNHADIATVHPLDAQVRGLDHAADCDATGLVLVPDQNSWIASAWYLYFNSSAHLPSPDGLTEQQLYV